MSPFARFAGKLAGFSMRSSDPKWQTSIAHLFLSITWIGCALALLPLFPVTIELTNQGIVWMHRRYDWTPFSLLCMAFVALLGAGIGALFRKSRLGALIGGIVGSVPGVLLLGYDFALQKFSDLQ
jgi:hypothetical protein